MAIIQLSQEVVVGRDARIGTAIDPRTPAAAAGARARRRRRRRPLLLPLVALPFEFSGRVGARGEGGAG